MHTLESKPVPARPQGRNTALNEPADRLDSIDSQIGNTVGQKRNGGEIFDPEHSPTPNLNSPTALLKLPFKGGHRLFSSRYLYHNRRQHESTNDPLRSANLFKQPRALSHRSYPERYRCGCHRFDFSDARCPCRIGSPRMAPSIRCPYKTSREFNAQHHHRLHIFIDYRSAEVLTSHGSTVTSARSK